MTTNTVRGERALHSGSYPEFPGSTPGLATISLGKALGASNLDRAHDAERTR